MLESLFKLRELGTDVRTEAIAGLTTFLAMAYIIFVNPSILAAAGMDQGAVFVATCFAAAIGCFIMGLYANYPIALAPGMGLNAYFAFTVVGAMGMPWQVALAGVFMSGVLFVIITVAGIRELLVRSIPRSLKFAISAGIGLFLGIISLKNAGIVVASPATLVTLGDLHKPEPLLALAGFFAIVALDHRKVTGAVILSILGVTAAAIALGHITFTGLVSAPPSIMPTLGQLDFAGALHAGLFGVVLTFFLVELFDATGTMLGVANRAKLLDADGNMPRMGKALLADSSAIVIGSVLGTSSTTAYIESAAGTAAGGRSGLTAVVVGVCFLAALFFAPLAGMVPAYATAPALLYVAVLMAQEVSHIEWEDLTEAIPAGFTAIVMPLTFSIANGIAFGFISYVAIKVLAGRGRDVSAMVWVIAALFVIRFAFFAGH